jgi:hypothetical protein
MCGADHEIVRSERIELLLYHKTLRDHVLKELKSNPRFLLRKLLCIYAEVCEANREPHHVKQSLRLSIENLKRRLDTE